MQHDNFRNNQNPAVSLHSVFLYSDFFSQQTPNFSMQSIHLFVFVMEKQWDLVG